MLRLYFKSLEGADFLFQNIEAAIPIDCMLIPSVAVIASGGASEYSKAFGGTTLKLAHGGIVPSARAFCPAQKCQRRNFDI